MSCRLGDISCLLAFLVSDSNFSATFQQGRDGFNVILRGSQHQRSVAITGRLVNICMIGQQKFDRLPATVCGSMRQKRVTCIIQVICFCTLVDYDIHYSKLNIWQFLGNWTFASKATLNLILDYRNSPILTTSNALIGQTTGSIDELKDSYSVSEIEDIASDRTARARLAKIGISSPLTERFQISSDLTVTDLPDSGSSAGVEGIVGTGAGYFYSLQLVGSNLIKPGDIAIFEARYADTTDTISLSVNTRYPVTRAFRINPRFRVDFRNNSNDDSDQVIYRPSLRLNYQLKRRLRFEAELGGEWSEREIADGSDKSRSYFINIGYRADF